MDHGVACPKCVEQCLHEKHNRCAIKAPVPAAGHPRFLKTVLDDGFMRSFTIPKAFVERHGDRFHRSNTVDLVVEANNKAWLVDVHSPTPNVAVFKLGWKVFATDNQLKAGDSVLFTLLSKSRFAVNVFNRLGVESTNWSSTDSTSFKFNMPNLHSSPVDVGDLRNEGAESEESDTSESDNPQRALKFPSATYTDAGRFRNETEPHGPPIRGIVQECSSKRAQPGTPKAHDAMANPKLSYHHIGHLGQITRPAPAMIYNEEQSLWQVESAWNSRTFESRRRAVTKEERKRAMENACSLQTQHPSVAVLMKPSHVYRGHWLTIPSEFAVVHMPKEGLPITLQDKYERKWAANWVVSDRTNGGISGGWAAFSLDHRLEEGDVCVFEVLSSNHVQWVILVHIFRVLDIDLEPDTRGGWNVAYKLVQGHHGFIRAPRENIETEFRTDQNDSLIPCKKKKNLAKVLHSELCNGRFTKRNHKELTKMDHEHVDDDSCDRHKDGKISKTFHLMHQLSQSRGQQMEGDHQDLMKRRVGGTAPESSGKIPFETSNPPEGSPDSKFQ